MILDRFIADKYARAIINGKRDGAVKENNFLDKVACLISGLLEAQSAPGFLRAKNLGYNDKKRTKILNDYGRENVERILKRVQKLL